MFFGAFICTKEPGENILIKQIFNFEASAVYIGWHGHQTCDIAEHCEDGS